MGKIKIGKDQYLMRYSDQEEDDWPHERDQKKKG